MWSIILGITTLLIFRSDGQQEASFKRLTDEEVPKEVIAAFSNKYGELEVVNWELHLSQKQPERYVAIFDHEGLRHRARFNTRGEGLSVSTYFLFNRLRMLPQAIIQTCEQDFADHRIGSGEKITSLKSNKIVYRIRLRKAADLKVIYLDPEGNELDPNELAPEFQAIEDNQ